MGPGGFGEGRGGVAAGFLRTSPFTMISMPPNTGSLFEANKVGRAHGGYKVDEGVRDGVTSPLLAALQDRWAQGGSPVKKKGTVGVNMEAPASARQQLGNNNAMLVLSLSPPLTMSCGHWPPLPAMASALTSLTAGMGAHGTAPPLATAPCQLRQQ